MEVTREPLYFEFGLFTAVGLQIWVNFSMTRTSRLLRRSRNLRLKRKLRPDFDFFSFLAEGLKCKMMGHDPVRRSNRNDMPVLPCHGVVQSQELVCSAPVVVFCP